MYEVFRFQGFCLILSPSDDHCFYYTYQKKPCQFIFTQTFGMVWYFKYFYQMQDIWFPERSVCPHHPLQACHTLFQTLIIPFCHRFQPET